VQRGVVTRKRGSLFVNVNTENLAVFLWSDFLGKTGSVIRQLPCQSEPVKPSQGEKTVKGGRRGVVVELSNCLCEEDRLTTLCRD